MNRLKALFVLLLLLVLSLTFACAAPDNVPAPAASLSPQPTEAGMEGETHRIGYSALNAENVFFKEFTDYLQEYAQEMNVSLTLHDGRSDVAQQMNAIESWVKDGYDAVICSPVDPVALQPVADYCMANGVPFINADAECERKTSYIGVNQYAYGYAAGEIAAEWINGALGGREWVACAIITKPQSLSIIERANGISAGLLENCPTAVIVAEYPVATVSEVEKVTRRAIREYPELACIVSVMDAGIVAASEELLQEGVEQQAFCLVGMDATAATLKSIQEGTIIRGTVDQNTSYFAKKCLELAVDAIEGKGQERIELSFTPVTEKNIGEYID